MTEKTLNNGSTTYVYTSYLESENRDIYDIKTLSYTKSEWKEYEGWAPIKDYRGDDRSYKRGLLTDKIYCNNNGDTLSVEKIKYKLQNYAESNYTMAINLGTFIMNKYKIENYAILPTEVIRNEYRNNSIIMSRKQSLYNDNGLKKTETDVDNNLVTEYKYPSDMKNISPYSDMVQNNILDCIVEKKVNKSGNVLFEEKYEYSPFTFADNKLYLLSATYTKNRGESEYRLSTKFDKYDALGNPTSIRTIDNFNTVYLWGYEGLYPIAEIKNATYDEVSSMLGKEPNALYKEQLPDTARIESLRKNYLMLTYKFMRTSLLLVY